jgi:hypothetical protein
LDFIEPIVEIVEEVTRVLEVGHLFFPVLKEEEKTELVQLLSLLRMKTKSVTLAFLDGFSG